MKSVYASPEFQALLKNSMYHYQPEKAVVQEFFAGVIVEVVPTDRQTIIIRYTHRPALTTKEILERKKDARFCQFCFRFEKHNFDCKYSGWKI